MPAVVTHVLRPSRMRYRVSTTLHRQLQKRGAVLVGEWEMVVTDKVPAQNLDCMRAVWEVEGGKHQAIGQGNNGVGTGSTMAS